MDRKPPGVTIIEGSSLKPLALLTCEDVHHGPLPIGTHCMCICCLKSGEITERRIAASYAPDPIEPTDTQYSATTYTPGPLKGGLG